MGFEPTDARTSPVFKTGSFNRSDISPRVDDFLIISDLYLLVNTYFLYFRKKF